MATKKYLDQEGLGKVWGKMKSHVSSAISGKANSATTLSGYGITDAYTKSEVDGLVSSTFHYKGSKATYAQLPTTGNAVGDVWNIEAADAGHNVKAGDNVAWNGTDWDVLSGVVDLSGYQTKLTAQTAYSAKGSATKVPQITTNALGQVTSITEVAITQPTVNDATLTIKRNNTEVGTFTANASADKTINITVPTKTSDLTHDSGFALDADLVAITETEINAICV